MSLRAVVLAVGIAAASASANAAGFVVDAKFNSSSGGVGLDTVTLDAGQSFSVSAGLNDLWSAGQLPRWSNANGLTGNLFASALDDSGVAIGTLIGQSFGSYTQGNLTAAYGTLVGQIGGGDYFALGTSFSGTAAASGVLKLYYWDSNAGDNTGSIAVNVNAVPEPETYAMLLAGLGAIGFMSRRRKTQQQ